MAYLVIKSNGRTHRVALEKETTIGRANTCDLWFPDDKTLSREHCKIRQLDNGQWMLVDMNSRNGTYVHGRRVEWQLLGEDDQFSVGDVTVIFHAGPFVTRPAHPGEALEEAMKTATPATRAKSADDANDLHATKVTVYNESLMPAKVSLSPTEGEPVVKPYGLPFQRPRPEPKIKR